MRILTVSTLALGAALLLGFAGTSPSFAKGHSQGVGGNGTAGQGTAGLVDNGQSNRDGMGSATAYGTTDASVEAKNGTQDNREAAQAAGNPSDSR
jgi:type IV secretory pathway VirB6-like protein